MKEVSLFTGLGGGIYGSLILGWQTIAYVERNKYCQKLIKQRIQDGWFDNAKIYSDIKRFNDKHAYKYKGYTDILTGGFPCQPYSVAGKREGTSDDRYLWDEIERTIQIIRPARLFFENVQGLLSSSAIIAICNIIESLGYQLSKPLLLGSDDCGQMIDCSMHPTHKQRELYQGKRYAIKGDKITMHCEREVYQERKFVSLTEINIGE